MLSILSLKNVIRLAALSICWAVLVPSLAHADKLVVVVKPVPPFVIIEDGQIKGGYSIDLWNEVAKQAGYTDVEFKQVKTPQEMVDMLKAGQADVGVAALSITSERAKVIDFSHPFYDSGLDILIKGGGAPGPLELFKRLFTPELVLVFVGILVALVIVSHILWLLERHHNPKQFPHGYKEGVIESIWWTTCVLIGGSCMNKDPEGIAGRVVGTVWALVGIAMIAYLTATASSIMTVDTLSNDINGPRDLAGKKVATLKGSSAEKYLTENKDDVISCESLDAAVDALNKGQADAVVYDSPVLMYYLANHDSGKLHLVGKLFEKQKYGFGLQQGSKIRQPINAALLTIEEGDFLEKLDKLYFTPTEQ